MKNVFLYLSIISFIVFAFNSKAQAQEQEFLLKVETAKHNKTVLETNTRLLVDNKAQLDEPYAYTITIKTVGLVKYIDLQCTSCETDEYGLSYRVGLKGYLGNYFDPTSDIYTEVFETQDDEQCILMYVGGKLEAISFTQFNGVSIMYFNMNNGTLRT